MPSYIVTLNNDATPEQIEEAKKHAVDQGGKIGQEYSLTFKGFAVEFPKDSVQSLESNQHVKRVEENKSVSTQ